MLEGSFPGQGTSEEGRGRGRRPILLGSGEGVLAGAAGAMRPFSSCEKPGVTGTAPSLSCLPTTCLHASQDRTPLPSSWHCLQAHTTGGWHWTVPRTH